MNAVGDFGHERFCKTNDVIFIVIFEKRRIGKAASVGGVIVGAVVVHGPVHELEITVGAISVEVEKIGQAHLPEAKFKAAFGEFLKQGVGSALGGDFLAAERNDLVPHQAGDVRRFAESGIAHDIKVEKAGGAEDFAQAMAAGFLDIA